MVWGRTVLITVVLAAASADAAAQSAVCEMVRPGDTASIVSHRLTGRATSHDESWFRVFDRSRSRVIPRAQYHRLQAGWQACVPAIRAVRHPPADGPRAAPPQTRALPLGLMTAARSSLIEATTLDRRTLEVSLLLLGLAASGAAVVCGWRSLEQVAITRKALEREMLAFGRAFLNHFESPLVVDGATGRPVHARMRCVARERRLDILLAPASGRRYPNLTDHRRNVEYDVYRIAQCLQHHPFVPSEPRAEGEWVVIPFYFRPAPKTGVIA